MGVQYGWHILLLFLFQSQVKIHLIYDYFSFFKSFGNYEFVIVYVHINLKPIFSSCQSSNAFTTIACIPDFFFFVFIAIRFLFLEEERKI